MDASATVRPTPEQRDAICNALLGGCTTAEAGQRVGRSQTWASAVARQSGLVFSGTNQFDGRWVRKEQTAVSNGEWNMSTEDYEALLKPEREHTNGNGATPESAATELPSIDDDIQEALNLLSRAEQQRKDDIKAIEQLRRQLADADRIAANISDKADQLRNEKRELETRVLQLETENKRLMEKLKGEISRGLLRQGMDSLRKVL